MSYQPGGVGRCSLRPRRVASRPNTAAGDGIWVDFEVSHYGLQARRQPLYARADLDRFMRAIAMFNSDRTGEALLRTARPDLSQLRETFPFSRDAPPPEEAPPEVRLRIFAVGLARHVAFEARVVHSHNLKAVPVTDSLAVTFELDPTALLRYAAELESDLAQI